MKVVITGDTHESKKEIKLPEALREELENADFVIHTGDFSTMAVYEALSRYAPVIGVKGNVEDDHVHENLPEAARVELNGFHVGVVHGDGSQKTTERRAMDAFKGEGMDVIVFGHSHIPVLRYFKKQLLINPGSPTDKRWNPYYSFAIMHLGSGFRVEHVFFD